MNLVPLFEEALEFQDYNGTVLSDGKVTVYYIGRTRLADIYTDVEGSVPAENPRILNNLGMGPVYVNPAFDYEMVVFDTYGSELFSVKKYLASKGEHSTANVVVTPSESIAVSAWTVGDVQVYMPYLTGQLGKVYTGIDPIVVNNTEDKISANHVPLGVQDPLYFVQDDEEGCIIGLSSVPVPEGTMNESAFGYEDGQITSYNGSAFSAGNSYEAGNYISIDNNTLSVTGLTPVPADTASTGLVASVSADITAMIPDTSDMATKTWVNEQGFLTAHQDISNKLDTTAFSTVSGDFITAIPDNYATKDYVQSGLSSKLDCSSFSSVSSTFLTAHQSLDGLMSADLLEISDNKITGYNGTAFAGQGGGVTGDFTLVEGNGIQLTDDPIAQTTTISVSGDYATNTQLQTVSGEITALIPSTAGLATEDWVTGQGYITNDAITGKQDITGMTAYATVESLTAKQDAGEYLSASDSANFLLTSDSGNFYPMNENPSGYLTAHQSLADYQTTADMVNYQTTAGMTAYLTGVPDTYLQNTDLSTTDGKVTAISGIPLSAGGDVPEGVMVESGLEYNAVNEISAYNGSAIAQYGAEKQWIVVDDTLLTLSNSAQFALGVNISAVAQLLGVDETVLWSGNVNISANPVITANEAVQNFEKVEFIGKGYPTNYDTTFGTCFFNSQSTDSTVWLFGHAGGSNGGAIRFNQCRISASDNILAIEQTKQFNITGTATTTGTTPAVLTKIIGIGRKA